MSSLFIVVLVCLLAACVLSVGTLAWLGYSRVKAGFNIGRSEFYIEADNPRRPLSGKSGAVAPVANDVAGRVSGSTRRVVAGVTSRSPEQQSRHTAATSP